jgi:hypothetical protein
MMNGNGSLRKFVVNMTIVMTVNNAGIKGIQADFSARGKALDTPNCHFVASSEVVVSKSGD